MKMKPLALLVHAALIAMAAPAMADIGPSTATAPYVVAIAPGVELTSILTTGDAIGGYTFSGIPDGMGAYDNEDGTFTLLVNHEMFADDLGGTIEMLLDGTSAKGDYQMFDNMTVNADGSLILQEDPDNNAHNAELWKFNPATGEMIKQAGFDVALFGYIDPVTGAVTTGSITKDEETSGVIDVTELLDREDDKTYNLFVVQNHKISNDPVTVEGGQMLLMAQPAPKHDDGDGHEDGDHK
jgi:hypothetical protein